MIDGLCQRWGVGPDTVLAQDAGIVLGIIAGIAEEAGVEKPLTLEEQMMLDLASHSEVLSGE